MKYRLVIESAAPYCNNFTTRKLPNVCMKKRKSYINALNFTKYFFFPLKDGHKSLFINCTIHKKIQKHQDKQKKIRKNYHYKLITKIMTLAFYRSTKSFSIFVSCNDHFGNLYYLKQVLNNKKTGRIIAIIRFQR